MAFRGRDKGYRPKTQKGPVKPTRTGARGATTPKYPTYGRPAAKVKATPQYKPVQNQANFQTPQMSTGRPAPKVVDERKETVAARPQPPPQPARPATVHFVCVLVDTLDLHPNRCTGLCKSG